MTDPTKPKRPAASSERGQSAFEEQASHAKQGLIGEYVSFLRHNRKWYLIPIVVALFVLGALIVVAGTSIAPFIYAMF